MNPKIASLAFGCVLAFASTQADAQVITQWTFDNLTAGTTNTSPAPSTGSGTASSLGMALVSGPDASNIYALAGTDTNNTSSSNNTWRVVGTNGWNSTTAIGTQGARFDASTVGFSNIQLSFDISISSQGEANLEVLYSTNGGTNWANASTLSYTGTPVSPATGTILTNSSNANIVNGTYFHGEANNGNDVWYNGITVNLSGVAAANNDPNLEFEIVNASTGAADVGEKSNTALNNTSGNWRFDDVTVQSVPEPSAWVLGVVVAVAFVGLRRRGATTI
jgi:hypothetical protein